MEALLKRHFWIVTLVGLGLIAWLLAATVNAGVGMWLARSGRGDDKPKVAAAGGESALTKRLREGRMTEEGAAMLDSSEMFLIAEPPAPVEPEPPLDPKADEAAAAAPPEPTFEPTGLPLKLLGTMVVSPDEFSSATVEVEKRDQKLVSRGVVLLDGKAEVMAIRRNYVVLKEEGKLTIMPLFVKEATPAQPGEPPRPGEPPKPVEPARTPPRTSTAPTSRQVAGAVEGVQKLSDTAYKLERKHVNDKMKDLASLGQQVRIVPNYKNGKYSGVRMIGMQDTSLFKDMGFENGDILLAVNGDHLDSPNKALSLYEALKNKARLTVLLERGGIDKTLRYTIQ
jgi:general secretion pathway protein C